MPDGADPAAPGVTVTPRCSAACDVLAQIGTGALAERDTVSLPGPGTGRIDLHPGLRPLASLRGGPVRVQLRCGGPGARRATAKTVTFRLRRLPDAPRPKVLGAAARRSGDDVIVTWHTDRDARPSNFVVFGSRTRMSAPDYIAPGDVKRSGRRFRILLERAQEVRYVSVIRARTARSSSRRRSCACAGEALIYDTCVWLRP